ncbi:Trp biosynthesis-associated membrane protein [Pseudoclavibacter sp. CFCC 11306]|uniref:Trp biosynthesis-associated membrane protein n=1 Tax=Pseudoclavibacter sp. CFCC 11306 TaxID=1564493 RepID=UPI00130180DE|nr:Trp biosynthesis-associated membrane protein [Pseudoclavibacter sp. CFCC 11306]KAB1658256.1 Trp biosynthesis-associated membrane protein [Pseudoclavibacter sp. CFCC 11306]
MSEHPAAATAKQPTRSRASGRGGVVVIGLALAGVLTLSASQPWLDWSVGSAHGAVHVTGQQAVGAVQAYGLTALAVTAVMGLSGVVLTRVLAVIEGVLGAVTIWSVQTVWRDPLAVSLNQLAEATGVSGPRTLATLVGEPTSTGWVWVALAAAALIVVHAVWVFVVAGRWKRTVRRFQKPTAASVSGPSPVDAAESAQTWDAFSVGIDPTENDDDLDDGAGDRARRRNGGPDDPGTLEQNPRPRGEQ